MERDYPDTLPTESSDGCRRSGAHIRKALAPPNKIAEIYMRMTLPPIPGWQIGCGVPSLKPYPAKEIAGRALRPPS